MPLLLNAASDAPSKEASIAMGILIALVVVAIALAVVTIISFILRLKIFFAYYAASHTQTEHGYTSETATRALLDKIGADGVKVERAGFFRALIYGNHYNPSKKTIFLRRVTINSRKVSQVAIAVQKVGLVMQDRDNSASFRSRWRLQQLGLFGPIFFLPLVIVGFIVDLAAGFTGLPLLLFSVAGLLFFLASFILTLLNIPVEKRANKLASEALLQTDIFTESEYKKAQKVYKSYIAMYVSDFLVNLLKLIQLILKIALQVALAMMANKNDK